MVAAAVLAHTGIDHVALSVLAAALVAGYGLAALRVPGWRGRATWCWGTGVGVVLVASLPVFETLAARSFTGHMVQHLLVIVIAAPLLVAGQPVRLARLSRPGTRRHGVKARGFGAAWRHYGALVAPFAFVVVLFVTHLTSIYDDALHDRWLHEVEHAAYLLSAVAVWAAVLGAGRAAATARIGAGFVVIAGGALLGMILLSASEPLMPTYAARLGTAKALDDQRAAAALMWTAGMLTTLPLLVVALWRWAAREDRLVRQAEALLDAHGPVREL